MKSRSLKSIQPKVPAPFTLKGKKQVDDYIKNKKLPPRKPMKPPKKGN